MITFTKTTATNKDFLNLVGKLDAYLAITDGEYHAFYNQFNSVKNISHVVLCYKNDLPVGCGAFKIVDNDTVEIKRMFTLPTARKKGVASSILKELEQWAQALGYTHCKLETGIRQPEAIALYLKCGYYKVANYGQYIGVDDSVCFAKQIT